MIEIYKSVNRLSPSLVWEFHEKRRVEYSLRIKTFANYLQYKLQALGWYHCLLGGVSSGIP